MRRALWMTVVDLLESVQPPEGARDRLRVTSLDIDLPLEVALRRTGGSVELLANPPRWRWSTVFDARPARLTCAIREEPVARMPRADGGPHA